DPKGSGNNAQRPGNYRELFAGRQFANQQLLALAVAGWPKIFFHRTRGKFMRQKKQDERGVALVLALIALLIVTSIGLSMMYSADTETSINGNYRDEQTAFYAAKSG